MWFWGCVYVCVCEGWWRSVWLCTGWQNAAAFCFNYTGKASVCLTLSVSLPTEVHAAHNYSVPVGTCQRRTLATMPCLQLQRGLWTSWLANTAGIKQIMKPDIPSPPCPAPTAAKACFSSHKRCTIERLSLSLFRSPSFFYFSLVLILPVGKARCQPLPKAGHSALTL